MIDKVTNEIRGLSDNTFTGFILGQELYQPVVALVLSQDGRKFSKEHSMLAIIMARQIRLYNMSSSELAPQGS